MHLLGDQMSTKLIRDGVELEPLSPAVRYFDEGFQSIQFYEPGRTLKPGDTLLTTCKYKATSGIRSSLTVAGQGTLDEMCQDFLQCKFNVYRCFT